MTFQTCISKIQNTHLDGQEASLRIDSLTLIHFLDSSHSQKVLFKKTLPGAEGLQNSGFGLKRLNFVFYVMCKMYNRY